LMDIKKIWIEQGIRHGNRSFDSELKITGGYIRSVKGITGITQMEEVVDFILKDKQWFKLPAFLWMHYHSIVMELEYDKNTVLVFSDAGQSTKINVSDIGESPLSVEVDERTCFEVNEYVFQATGSLSITPSRVTAGECYEFNLEYTVGPNGIAMASPMFNSPYATSICPAFPFLTTPISLSTSVMAPVGQK
jgi:hypothetical protein